jgi:hypothetical protein
MGPLELQEEFGAFNFGGEEQQNDESYKTVFVV